MNQYAMISSPKSIFYQNYHRPKFLGTNIEQLPKIWRFYTIVTLSLQKYADRINGCSGYLKFGVDANNGKLVLKEVWFCRVRHCPVCQWRRSLKMRAMMYQNIEGVIQQYPSHRWVFLTLTVKNPHVTDLRATLDNMNKGWKRLIQSKRFDSVVDGFIRTTEVTRPRKQGQENEAHPHFHAMLLVKSTYFHGSHYINQAEWAEMWRKAMRLITCHKFIRR